jgi:prepilin-type N-terminal cleavage/methylation domain-containing protein
MQNSQTGFTFIEMVIVIAIVGVLASIAVVSYS